MALRILSGCNYSFTSLNTLLINMCPNNVARTKPIIDAKPTIKRLIFDEINFRDISFRVDLILWIGILPYFAWIYFWKF